MKSITNFGKPVLFILAVFWLFSACTKDDNKAGYGEPASVNVQLIGAFSPEQAGGVSRDQIQSARSGRELVSGSKESQVFTMNLDNGLALVAELTPVDVAAYAGAAKQQTSKEAKAATVDRTLLPGVAYHLLAYSAQGGQLVGQKTYTVDKVSDNVPFTAENLLIGSEYIFVAYSNGTATPPTLTNAGTYTDAVVQLDNNKQFLYWTKKVTLVQGTNLLEINLEHQFSQINSVRFTVSHEVDGKINVVNNMRVVSRNDVSASLSNVVNFGGTDNIVVKNLASNGSVGHRTYFADYGANPVIVPLPQVYYDERNTELRIGEMTIGTVAKTNLTMPLRLDPGVHYDVKLTIKSFTPEGIIIGNSEWAPGNLVYDNGVYGFAPDQFTIGDLWYWNWLLPEKAAGSNRPTNGPHGTMIKFSVDRDPCTKVAGGGWRTPNKSDYQAIWDIGLQASVAHDPIAPNIQGYFFGRKSRPANLNDTPYVFIPAAPVNVRDYFYWITENIERDNGGAFLAGNGGYHAAFSNTNSTHAQPIRCVRSKK